jgi:hypothetical protein
MIFIVHIVNECYLNTHRPLKMSSFALTPMITLILMKKKGLHVHKDHWIHNTIEKTIEVV